LVGLESAERTKYRRHHLRPTTVRLTAAELGRVRLGEHAVALPLPRVRRDRVRSLIEGTRSTTPLKQECIRRGLHVPWEAHPLTPHLA
jgi:hypothetical protein